MKKDSITSFSCFHVLVTHRYLLCRKFIALNKYAGERTLVKHYTLLLLVTLVVGITSCSNISTSLLAKTPKDVPENWQGRSEKGLIDDGWVADLKSPKLLSLIDTALSNNLLLKQQSYDVHIMKQHLVSANNALWPSSEMTLLQSRKDSGESAIENKASIEIGLNYELDIWGKLSAGEQKSHLAFLAQKSRFEYQRRQLAVDVANAWLNRLEAAALRNITAKQVSNAAKSLEIMSSEYQRGLVSLLDLSFARNELHAFRINLTLRESAIIDSTRALEKLLGRYPAGTLAFAHQSQIPSLPKSIYLGIPADIIERNPALVASWSDVLALNANLAFTHRQRLPSFKLSADISKSADNIVDVFSGPPLAWSLLGNITTPLFNRNQLKTNEEIARLTLQQAEHKYLEDVYNTYLNIETALSNESSLKIELTESIAAEESSALANRLSQEQYQRGLSNYSTVLDAQERFYIAQINTVKTQSKLIANRIQLHHALGGNFEATSQPGI